MNCTITDNVKNYHFIWKQEKDSQISVAFFLSTVSASSFCILSKQDLRSDNLWR